VKEAQRAGLSNAAFQASDILLSVAKSLMREKQGTSAFAPRHWHIGSSIEYWSSVSYLPILAAVVRGRAFTNRPSIIARDLSAVLTAGFSGNWPACATNQSILCPGTNPLAAIVKTSVRLGARLV
jgi:hypothetical protein